MNMRLFGVPRSILFPSLPHTGATGSIPNLVAMRRCNHSSKTAVFSQFCSFGISFSLIIKRAIVEVLRTIPSAESFSLHLGCPPLYCVSVSPAPLPSTETAFRRTGSAYLCYLITTIWYCQVLYHNSTKIFCGRGIDKRTQ